MKAALDAAAKEKKEWSIEKESVNVIRPPRTVVPGGLMFYCCFCLFVCFWHFAGDIISELPTDTRLKMSTLGHRRSQNCLQNNFGAMVFFTCRPQIYELLHPIAVKLCQMMGNK